MCASAERPAGSRRAYAARGGPSGVIPRAGTWNLGHLRPPTRPRRGDTRNFLVSAELADATARVHLNAMCGRFASYLPPEAIAALFRTVNPLPNIGPTWNMAPTRDAMAVRRHPESGARRLDLLNWGFLPHWTKDPKQARRPINAKAETVASSGMFRDAFARRRALIPAALFYEWRPIEGQKAKQPFAIARQDGKPLALAGIWEGWRGAGGEVIRSFAIITTEANQLMSQVHKRMPVILEEADWPVWLGEREGDPPALLRPAQEVTLQLWPVSPLVNNVRNDSPELVQQVA